MPYDPITLLSTLSTIVLPPDTQDSLSVSWLDSYRMGFPPMKHYTLCWAHTNYPFEAWNADQDLYSAMESSVNWYFQEIDGQIGASALRNYVKKIGYGNENISSDLSSYWMQSTLKISPVEQVELLKDLYNNDFGFTPENVNTIKDSICLFSTDERSFYGKTGTGRIDGQDVNGWFVGFVCTNGNTYFFATNIQGNANATGNSASEITKSILSELNIWE